MPGIRRPGERARTRRMLIVLCGPSHAGKTSFARECCGGLRIVSSDATREQHGTRFARAKREDEVWQSFESQKRRALGDGRDVVLDACHMSARARWHAIEGTAAGHRKICIVFDLPWRAVRRRCRMDGRVRLEEVRRMWKAFDACKPSRDDLLREGFDEVYVVRG